MNSKLAKEIQVEQLHGRQKYGRGPNDFNHDDSHSQEDWQQLILNHTEMLTHATPREFRQRLIKIAGLAVSAVESFDRKNRPAIPFLGA